MNHTRFPKEDHLPDCESRDNQVKKGDHVEYFPDCLCVPPSLLFDRYRRAKPSIHLRLIPSLRLQMSSWRAKGNFCVCREILLVRKLCGRMECLVLVLLRTVGTIILQDLLFSILYYDTMRWSFLTKGKQFCVNLYMFSYNYAKIKWKSKLLHIFQLSVRHINLEYYYHTVKF